MNAQGDFLSQSHVIWTYFTSKNTRLHRFPHLSDRISGLKNLI